MLAEIFCGFGVPKGSSPITAWDEHCSYAPIQPGYSPFNSLDPIIPEARLEPVLIRASGIDQKSGLGRLQRNDTHKTDQPVISKVINTFKLFPFNPIGERRLQVQNRIDGMVERRAMDDYEVGTQGEHPSF